MAKLSQYNKAWVALGVGLLGFANSLWGANSPITAALIAILGVLGVYAAKNSTSN